MFVCVCTLIKNRLGQSHHICNPPPLDQHTHNNIKMLLFDQYVYTHTLPTISKSWLERFRIRQEMFFFLCSFLENGSRSHLRSLLVWFCLGLVAGTSRQRHERRLRDIYTQMQWRSRSPYPIYGTIIPVKYVVDVGNRLLFLQ